MLALGLLLSLSLHLGKIRFTEKVSVQPVDSHDAKPETNDNKSEAELLFEGNKNAQIAIAAKVVADIERGFNADSFQTGNARFDGEWAAGSYQMGVFGLGQVILTHPELKDEYVPAMTRSLERLLTPEINRFGTEAWNESGLSALASDNGHAYLGYTNLALSMLRLVEPNNSLIATNDELTNAFVRRLSAAPYGLVETYPEEAYPVDVAAAIASISLYDRATGKSHEPLVTKLIAQFQQHSIDLETGLVFQAVSANSGAVVDRPRASGTALSAYFLSFADLQITKRLFQPISDYQRVNIAGFTGIREYLKGEEGTGDIDSGPLTLGASPSATLFSIGGARLIGDRALYQSLYDTVQFFEQYSGESPDTTLIESPLGHSMLLAMLTATSSQ